MKVSLICGGISLEALFLIQWKCLSSVFFEYTCVVPWLGLTYCPLSDTHQGNHRYYMPFLHEAQKLTTSNEIALWVTPVEASKALQTSGCSKLLSYARANCLIFGKHSAAAISCGNDLRTTKSSFRNGMVSRTRGSVSCA